jgi:hypothetical protein
MTYLSKPVVALAFGLFFLCAVTCAHFDQLATYPLGVVPDWAAGVFLVGGAVASRRDWTDGRVYQIAAWAFIASLLFGSMIGNFEEWQAAPAEGGTSGLVSMSQGTYLAIVTALFLVALFGLIASLRSRGRDSSSDHRRR